MSTNVIDTDMLTATRADLVAVLAELGIAHHDTEPRSLGEAPAAWFGRPSIIYSSFDSEVQIVWPLTLAGHPIDGENTTHDFDLTVWELWRALGLGRRTGVADAQRTVTALEARPSNVTLGDVSYPTYEVPIRTTAHIGIC